MNEMRQCRITRTSGSEDCTVSAFASKEAKRHAPPLLAWAEPDLTAVDPSSNTGGRRSDFIPLTTGAPCHWHEDLPLVEVRLFWESTALHVVSTGSGCCRWTWIEETENGEEVSREEYRVVTLRDRKRFGLGEQPNEIRNVKAVEYHENGHLVGWRLILADGEIIHG